MKEAYDVAEWLTYNHEPVVAMMAGAYKKAEAMKPSEARMYILDQLKYQVASHLRDLSYEDLELVFEDERVLIIVDKLFMKDFIQYH